MYIVKKFVPTLSSCNSNTTFTESISRGKVQQQRKVQPLAISQHLVIETHHPLVYTVAKMTSRIEWKAR